MELYRIYLLREYIGNSICKKLLLSCEDFLRSKKARKYHAYVWEENKAALDFYKKRLRQARGKIQEQESNMHRKKTRTNPPCQEPNTRISWSFKSLSKPVEPSRSGLSFDSLTSALQISQTNND